MITTVMKRLLCQRGSTRVIYTNFSKGQNAILPMRVFGVDVATAQPGVGVQSDDGRPSLRNANPAFASKADIGAAKFFILSSIVR